MINVMGGCFDEAYTRFLTEEERKLKDQLLLEWHAKRSKDNLVLSSKPESKTPDTFSSDISPPKAKRREKFCMISSSPCLENFLAKESQHPLCTSVRLEARNNKPDGKRLRGLTLKLTELTGRLVKNDSKILSSGYGTLQQSMIDLRDQLNNELSL